MLSHFCNILQSYPGELFGLYDEKVFKRTGKFRNGAVDWSVKIELCSEISICGGCGLFFGHSGEWLPVDVTLIDKVKLGLDL